MVALIADAFLPPHSPAISELSALRDIEAVTIDVEPSPSDAARAREALRGIDALEFGDDDFDFEIDDGEMSHRAPDDAAVFVSTKKDVPETVCFQDAVPRPVLSLLPTMADTRETPRQRVALKAWLMTLDGATRGYALYLSEGGARLGGMGTHHPVGSTLLAKICLQPHECPVVVRCEVVRYSAPKGRTLATEISVKFVDVNLDEWFRLARFLDKEAKANAKTQTPTALPIRAPSTSKAA